MNEELKLLWKWKCKKKYRWWGCQVRPGMGGGGFEGWGLADREGFGLQQCWG